MLTSSTALGTVVQDCLIRDTVPASEYGEEPISVFFNNNWAHLPIFHWSKILERDYSSLPEELGGRGFCRI
jgi:hypothetical protein